MVIFYNIPVWLYAIWDFVSYNEYCINLLHAVFATSSRAMEAEHLKDELLKARVAERIAKSKLLELSRTGTSTGSGTSSITSTSTSTPVYHSVRLAMILF